MSRIRLSQTHKQMMNTIETIGFGIAMASGTSLTCHVGRETDFEAHMPIVVQDIYEWVQLVFGIHHPLFHFPKCITYGKYKLILENMASITCSPELEILDPKACHNHHTLTRSLNAVDPMYRFLLDNYLVLVVMNTTKEIEGLDFVPTSQVTSTWTDEYRTLSLEGGNHNTIIRRVKFKAVHNSDQRTMIMRWKASESRLLNRTACVMMCDPSIPLRMIPGVQSEDTLRTLALSVDNDTMD